MKYNLNNISEFVSIKNFRRYSINDMLLNEANLKNHKINNSSNHQNWNDSPNFKNNINSKEFF